MGEIQERLIVGLGNPESEYADTRHNLGFACVRELARRLGVSVDRKRWQSLIGRSEAKRLWLVMPQRINGVADALALALQAGIERAMERYNRAGALGCEELP